jgi:putative copper export protein
MTDVLVAGLRLAHALAAAVWLGGTLTYALVHQSNAAPPRLAWRSFREALRLGIGVFVLTGVLLAAAQLSSAALPPSYMAVLAVKVALAIWMFALARGIGGPGTNGPTVVWWRKPEVGVLGLGVVIYGLAIALKSIYENTIRFH